MSEIENYLKEFQKITKDPSLDAMKFFMEKYNDFEKNMKFIHIAGTNGKGSCAEMIYSILVKQGYKVGKFISPCLIKYNEKISINGKEISDEELSKFIQEIDPLVKEYEKKTSIEITAFEFETIMALLYFYRNKVDFVVLETGLGGLYDCTNIITRPIVSIISSIGLDHMNILGNTLEEIAIQKAGIIKEKSDTVFMEQEKEIEMILENECNNKNNTFHKINKNDIKNYKFDSEYQYFDYKNMKNIIINLKGKKQIENASICIETIEIMKSLGYEISEKSIRDGLKTVIHKGRMEILKKNPLIIFDGAHNEPAIKNLKNSIDMYYKGEKRTYVISVLKRKDYKKVMELMLQDEEGEFILTSGVDTEEYATSKELYEIAMKYQKKQKITEMNLREALEYCLKNKDRVNFIIGSFYIYEYVSRYTLDNIDTDMR
jgi:dihydrofolate synthase/folylpolyglutamate synthase